MLLQRSGVAARASGEPLTWSHVDTQGSRRLPGSKLIVPGAEAHTTSHEPVRSEDELRRTAFGVGNRRVREVFKAGLANTLNRQRSEELRPLAVNPAWCVRELRDLRPGQTDPTRGACERASLIRKDQHRTTHGVSACAPLPLVGETTPSIPDSARWSQ